MSAGDVRMGSVPISAATLISPAPDRVCMASESGVAFMSPTMMVEEAVSQALTNADACQLGDAVAVTAGTPATVWTPASGKTVRLLGWALSSTAGAALEFQDSGTPGTVIAQTPLLAAAGVHTSPDIGEGVALAAADNTLELDVTATSTVSGMVFGVEE